MYNSWGLLLLSSGICYLVSMLLRGLEARPTATSKARPERYQKLRSPEQEHPQLLVCSDPICFPSIYGLM